MFFIVMFDLGFGIFGLMHTLCHYIYLKGIFEIYLVGGSLSNIDEGDEAEVGADVPVAVAAEAAALYPVPTQ